MISAIVLAAGLSRRMGKENKLLLPFGGKTLIEHQIDTILKTEVSEVIVVLGHEANQVFEVLKEKPVSFVKNLKYKKGMMTSIQAGVWCCNPESQGYMICLSDLPLLKISDYQKIIAAFKKEKKKISQPIIVPIFKGQSGHPVIFSSFYKRQIVQHEELNGAIEILQKNKMFVKKQVMSTDAILKDMDTKTKYQQLTSNWSTKKK